MKTNLVKRFLFKHIKLIFQSQQSYQLCHKVIHVHVILSPEPRFQTETLNTLKISKTCINLMASSKVQFNTNKKLYRAFTRQANRLTLHIPVLQGLLRVNSKAEKDA